MITMKHFSLLICVLVANVHLSYNKLIRRYLYSAILFDDEGIGLSRRVDFINTNKDEWKNLTELAIKHKLRSKSMFCSVGPGGWIAYPKESFDHNGTFYQLITGDACAPADILNSVQTIGFVFAHQTDSLALFSKPYFASQAKLLYNGSTSGDFKSLIYWGYSGITLEGTGKKGKSQYCLWRSFTDPKICVLPDVASELGLTSSQISIKHGCDFEKNKDLKLFFLQTCFDEGVEQVPIAGDMKITTMSEICKGSGQQDEKNLASMEFAKILDVWKSRILYESESFGRTQLNSLEDSPKVDAFLQFLDIFVDGCPYVNQHYLSLLGQVYLNHLKDLWKVRPEKNFDPSDTFDYLAHCWAAVKDSQGDFQAQAFCHPKQSIDFADGRKALAMDLMLQSDTFDTVIEQIWLMLNFVAPYCSHLGDYATNQWVEFPEVFKNVFLKPLEAQWMNPGIWERVYPIMFHGYDIHDQYARVLACVEGGLDLVPHMDPVGRTSGFNKIFFESRNSSWPEEPSQEAPRETREADSEKLNEMEEPEKIPEILEPIVVEPTEKPIEEIPDEEKEKEKQPSGRTMSKAKEKKYKKPKGDKKFGNTPKESQDNNQGLKDAGEEKVAQKESTKKEKYHEKVKKGKDKSKHKESKNKKQDSSSSMKKNKSSHPKGRSQSLKPKRMSVPPAPK